MKSLGFKEMIKKTRLAFYRGLRDENPKSLIGDWAVCWVTGHWASHVELVASMWPAWSEVLSSSLRDKGVRAAWRSLAPERWGIVEFDGDSTEAIAYIRSRIGTPYGWPDLLSFLLPFRVSTPWDFCSEVIAKAFKLADAWHKSPGDLYKWAEQQPGFRVLAADEFGIPWTA